MNAHQSTDTRSIAIAEKVVSPDPRDPTTFSRRILLAVTGLSPQIVTETLYALAVPNSGRPFVPTEIQLITTATGRNTAIDSLLRSRNGKPGGFHQLCADYDLDLMRFDPSCIHAVGGLDGKPLDDIRTQADSECVADCITEVLRGLTSDPDTALHVSLAGGRKTMGFYMGYALSLFARQQDRLSHVLVSAPFESHKDFFYPTPYDHEIVVNGASHNARNAKIVLANIPVVSLRRELPKRLQAGHASYTQTVEAMQRVLAPPELIVDVEAGLIQASGKVLRPQPTQFAILALLAYRAAHGLAPLSPPPPVRHARKYSDWSRDFIEHMQAMLGDYGVPRGIDERVRRGMTSKYFSPLLAKLRKFLAAQLGTAEHPYRIDDGSPKPKRYQLSLTREQILFRLIEAPKKRGARNL